MDLWVESNLLMEKAREKLDAARSLLKDGFYADSISRAYYSAFLSLKSVLLLLGEEPKTHEGARRMLGLLLVREGLVEKKYSRIFSELMNAREEGDYTPIVDFSRQEAESLIEKAQTFLVEMERVRREIRDKEQKLKETTR